MAGLFGLDDIASRIPNLSLHAAAADRADHGAVFPHQQLRRFVAWNGAVYLNYSRERTFLTETPQADEFVVDIHPPSIITSGSRLSAMPLMGTGIKVRWGW